MSILDASWIRPSWAPDAVCPVFQKEFTLSKPVKKAVLEITAIGVYQVFLGGKKVSDAVLMPGWTSYKSRLQYQQYDVTNLLSHRNELTVSVGKGWMRGRISWCDLSQLWGEVPAMIAKLSISYEDGSGETIFSDASWLCAKGPVQFSEIYDGEIYDARCKTEFKEHAVLFDYSKDILIPQEGEWVKEIQELPALKLITTPKGERVIDFGQNLTGYVRFRVHGNSGDKAELSHAEVLDRDGNFYTANLRSAKEKITYILSGEGAETYHPQFTFQGFRYIRLDSWPCEPSLEDFTAVVVHSELQRTGRFECADPLLNQLYHNVIWGQKGNFLDVPTDCPQRDERLGWTGDAQAFVRTASYNFNVLKFFKKWLHDLKTDQFDDGGVPNVIPSIFAEDGEGHNSAAWGDAATICPWQLYLTYGDASVLEDQFESMKRWVEYIRNTGGNEYLWDSGAHYGDWLGMDAPEGSYKGSTDEHLIATAFYAYSTSLLIKAGKVLGKDMGAYEKLYSGIVRAFHDTYFEGDTLRCQTQTAHVLALYFHLTPSPEKTAADLAALIHQSGDHLTTGFVGTPYLLHALSENGYTPLAYTLLLQQMPPSWLFSVLQGATTIWEHWDGIKKDGSFWSADMNSFNHYAYGAVADWMYGVMAGIGPDESAPGFRHILLRPQPDARIPFAKASIDTKYGRVASEWEIDGSMVNYKFIVPEGATAAITLGGETKEVGSGTYQFSKPL